MSRWTTAAERLWQEYCEGVRAALDGSDADADEVVDDLRRHVDEELSGQVATEADLRRVLGRLGPPADDGRVAVQAPLAPPPMLPLPVSAVPIAGLTRSRPRRPFRAAMIILFGVLLPLVAVGVESSTGICAETFFDPLPTPGHVAAFLLIPLASALSLAVRNSLRLRYAAPLNVLTAAALGVAIVYTILFVPILPFATIGLIALGLGACGFAPGLAVLALCLARRRLRAHAPRLARWGLFLGLVLGFVAVGLAELPIALTHMALEMAVARPSATQAQGIRWLRSMDQEPQLLEACYQRNATPTDWVGRLLASPRLAPEQARPVYYRVYGRSFNSVPPPRSLQRESRWLWDWEFDADQGGSEVGARLSGLTLESSQLDGELDPDAVAGYFEWTLTFRNASRAAREARAQVQLPPGAAVSRATLWIDGAPHEAAFGERAQTRGAYQSVVRTQRDPLLVTTSGPDCVLVQCFPVPAAGEMKIRIGMTAPLTVVSPGEVAVPMPRIVERNFSMPKGMTHAVWLDASTPLRIPTASLAASAPEPGRYSLRGDISDAALRAAVVRAERDPQAPLMWASDPLAAREQVVLQRIERADVEAPSRVALVVDASASMGGAVEQVAAALEAFPENVELLVAVAGDEVEWLAPRPAVLDAAGRATLAARLREVQTVGGADNLPALLDSWRRCEGERNAVILWVHGPQPMQLSSSDRLFQAYYRRPGGPEIVDVVVSPGPNAILAALPDGLPVTALPRLATLEDDLKGLFGRWAGTEPAYQPVREAARQRDGEWAGAVQATTHVARLWAVEQIDRLRRQGDVRAAVQMATRYQLVTPVSGAVVLENAQQYDLAGLEPVDPATVPTVPEPGTALLLAAGAAIAAAARHRRRARGSLGRLGAGNGSSRAV